MTETGSIQHFATHNAHTRPLLTGPCQDKREFESNLHGKRTLIIGVMEKHRHPLPVYAPWPIADLWPSLLRLLENGRNSTFKPIAMETAPESAGPPDPASTILPETPSIHRPRT